MDNETSQNLRETYYNEQNLIINAIKEISDICGSHYNIGLVSEALAVNNIEEADLLPIIQDDDLVLDVIAEDLKPNIDLVNFLKRKSKSPTDGSYEAKKDAAQEAYNIIVGAFAKRAKANRTSETS